MTTHTILLVEDDELDVISVQRTLKKIEAEYRLYIAHNGKEALTMLTNSSQAIIPDVILLDLNMPKMNGIEFLREIRQDEKLKHVKVFVMTTSDETIDRSATEKLGISGFIIKPLSYTGNAKRTDSMDAFMQFHLRKILSESKS